MFLITARALRTPPLMRRESQMNPFPTSDALEQLLGAMRTFSLEWREPHTTSLDAAQAVREPTPSFDVDHGDPCEEPSLCGASCGGRGLRLGLGRRARGELRTISVSFAANRLHYKTALRRHCQGRRYHSERSLTQSERARERENERNTILLARVARATTI